MGKKCQKVFKVISSKDTIKAGANYIIVGRGIYQSDNPAAAAEQYSLELV